MNLKLIASALVLAGAAAGTTACQQIPDQMTVVEYCSNPNNLNKDVCKVNVEIDGQKKALAETNMNLSQARQIADAAMSKANNAQSTADQALQQASAAMSKDTTLNCETKTIQHAKSGSCAPGMKLLSCTQTRYTFKAGAPSILRKVSDDGCTFNGKVLEMQVRCCTVGPMPETATPASVEAQPTKPSAPEKPAQSS
ncbi:MAG TPA: hypothetical protein VG942_08390 [Hyphomonadaceae bacterium]|nr:hypothetical protein [Hyphomonadaceae bacterium]